MEIKEITKPVERIFELKLTYSELLKIRKHLFTELNKYHTGSATYKSYQNLIDTIDDFTKT